MAKVMKSYRIDEQMARDIRECAAEIGVSETDVIRLAFTAFKEYEIDMGLFSAHVEQGKARDYETYNRSIMRSARGGNIANEVKAGIWTCDSIWR